MVSARMQTMLIPSVNSLTDGISGPLRQRSLAPRHLKEGLEETCERTGQGPSDRATDQEQHHSAKKAPPEAAAFGLDTNSKRFSGGAGIIRHTSWRKRTASNGQRDRKCAGPRWQQHILPNNITVISVRRAKPRGLRRSWLNGQARNRAADEPRCHGSDDGKILRSRMWSVAGYVDLAAWDTDFDQNGRVSTHDSGQAGSRLNDLQWFPWHQRVQRGHLRSVLLHRRQLGH